jgi:hypothetical protein
MTELFLSGAFQAAVEALENSGLPVHRLLAKHLSFFLFASRYARVTLLFKPDSVNSFCGHSKTWR